MLLAKEGARRELLKDIPANLMTKVRVTGNESIKWEEEGKEFSLNGEMYDVVKTKDENAIQYVYCLTDEKEDQVLDALEKVIQSNIDNTSHHGKHHSNAKIIIPDWVLDLQVVTVPAKNTTRFQKEYFTYKDSLLYSFIEINSPPPNLNFKLNTPT